MGHRSKLCFLIHAFLFTSFPYGWKSDEKTFVPVYVPVGVPARTSKPQNITLETFVVLVGVRSKNPPTVTSLAVSAMLVPMNVNVVVE